MRAMYLPDDLKDFSADDWDDGFQIVAPATAAKWLAVLLFAALVLEKYLPLLPF